jgi:hypothetical protein
MGFCSKLKNAIVLFSFLVGIHAANAQYASLEKKAEDTIKNILTNFHNLARKADCKGILIYPCLLV